MKKMLLFGGGFILLLAVNIWLISLISASVVPSDDPLPDPTGNFPQMRGTNLLLEAVEVPTQLDGDYRLLVVAYDSNQQPAVDKWLGPLEALNDEFPQLRGYYVPLLPQDTADAAIPILGGMTLAAPSDDDRARTIVVFTNIPRFNALVDVTVTDRVQLFLLDATGKIEWQGAGNYDPATLDVLRERLTILTTTQDA